MRVFKIALLSMVTVGLVFSLTSAADDSAKGKILFNDPKLGGGTSGMSCNSCHPEGKGLEKASDRKDLKEFVNACIQNALKGKAIEPASEEMTNLVAYVKSLKGKTPEAGRSKKK